MPFALFRRTIRIWHIIKFLDITNKRKEIEHVTKKYWEGLPDELHQKIVWFHSGMSQEFKEGAMEKL